LLQNPNILRASYTIDLPGEGFGSTTHGLEGRPNEEFFMVIMMYGDYDMAKTLDWKWLTEGIMIRNMQLILLPW
jgi:hypothetical protein